MKVKAPSLLRKIVAALSNTTNELRIRIMIFFLLHKNMDKTSLTHSLQALVSHHPHHHHQKKKNDDVFQEEGAYLVANQDDDYEEGTNNASLLMHYNQATNMAMMNAVDDYRNDKNNNMHVLNVSDHVQQSRDQKRPSRDLTHELIKESEAEMEEEQEADENVRDVSDNGRAVVVMEDVGDEDIDQAADLFIQRFRRQIQLQKQLSLERTQMLLQSNA